MALRQDPKAPQPHYVLGLIARAQNRFEEALAEFDQVLKIDPDDVGANINTGAVDWGLIGLSTDYADYAEGEKEIGAIKES
jgi:tetratricopeptide (TPR) repeat protein